MKESYRTPGLDIDKIVADAVNAAEAFRNYTQEQTDRIVEAVFKAGFNNRVRLAKITYDDTKLGKWEDKVIKNVIATQYVYQDIKNMKTVGVINEDREQGVVEVAAPVGPIFAVTPITNPSSTVLFKILIAMKSRNPIIIRPHGSARKCSVEACRLLYEAALEAGAPEKCVQWIKATTRDEVMQLMSHPRINLILATGSVELVRAAQKSGNPAIGIGPGNVPVYIGRSADIPFAVEQIVLSKTFDNGTVCASEQAVVVNSDNVDDVTQEFKKHKAYFLSQDEIKRLEPVAFNSEAKVMKVEVIGQSAATIAEMAGFKVPPDTSILIAPLEEVGIQSPLSLEILAPILALYVADNFEQAIELCRRINRHGGLGHTASIFSTDEEKIRYFSSSINAGRILVNTPASQGALGGTYNRLRPSLMLACGTRGKNITTDNISVRHLLNIHRIARRNVCPYMTSEFMHNFLDENLDWENMKGKFGDNEEPR
ncbi:MAG: aldehyde dehydrogenase family protein [candidate division WOR-3 bacterium]|nr:MAG: aldehyde dehydrogenase family protein [candidate division WOR-3 bacterium]